MPDERLKIWIDLLKWSVASVGLVIATMIIDAGFKDREIGIKELSLYNDHVDLVTNTENLAQRRLLAQYFAYVTPSEKLRSRWSEYYLLVDGEYQKVKHLLDARKKELDSIFRVDTVFIEVEKVQNLQDEIFQYEQELAPKTGKRDDSDLKSRKEPIGRGGSNEESEREK